MVKMPQYGKRSDLHRTAIACNGAARTGMHKRKRATLRVYRNGNENEIQRQYTRHTAQNANGVIIHVLYGLDTLLDHRTPKQLPKEIDDCSPF